MGIGLSAYAAGSEPQLTLVYTNSDPVFADAISAFAKDQQMEVDAVWMDQSELTVRLLAASEDDAMQYLEKANEGHEPAYGNDRWTAETCEYFREIFQADCDVYFVFNGTAANSLALSTYCKPYHSVICTDFAHIETDECGAPEFFSHGAKILLSPGGDGKLTYDGIEKIVHRRTDIHYPKPKAVSVTQATEVGTVYSHEQLLEVQRAAREFDLKIHMDGFETANLIRINEDTKYTPIIFVTAMCRPVPACVTG